MTLGLWLPSSHVTVGVIETVQHCLLDHLYSHTLLVFSVTTEREMLQTVSSKTIA